MHTEAMKLNNLAMESLDMAPGNNSDDLMENAISMLDEAIKLDGSYYPLYSNKFYLHNELRQFDKALITCQQLMELRPADPNITMELAKTYKRMGDSVNSRRYFQDALAKYERLLDTAEVESIDYRALQIIGRPYLHFLVSQPRGLRLWLGYTGVQ